MENSQQQPLAIESFSYSWLLDKRPPFDELVEPRRPSLGDCSCSVSAAAESCSSSNEVKKNLNTSNSRFLENFNFDVSVSDDSSVSLVHADEIFSDGYMMPVFRSNIQASTSAPATPISSLSTRLIASSSADDHRSIHQSSLIRKWKKSSSRILQKCSGFLRPLCQRLSHPRKSVRVDDLGRKVWEVQGWAGNNSATPMEKTSRRRPSMAYSAVDWAEVEKAEAKYDALKSLLRVKNGSKSSEASPLRRSASSVEGNRYDIECQIKEAILHCKRSIEK